MEPVKTPVVDLGTLHEFHGVQPVLPVADATRAARYFCDVLGFELDFIAGAGLLYFAALTLLGVRWRSFIKR